LDYAKSGLSRTELISILSCDCFTTGGNSVCRETRTHFTTEKQLLLPAAGGVAEGARGGGWAGVSRNGLARTSYAARVQL